MPTFVDHYDFPTTENANDTGTTLALATSGFTAATGDKVLMFAAFRATTGTMSITTTGGQTWTQHINAIDGFLFGVWSCDFDGTWDADPVITYDGSASPRILRAVAWNEHDGWSIAPTNDGDPGGVDQTFAFNTVNDNDLAILGGGQSDNNTGTVDNSFAAAGSATFYWRSSGGADFSTGLAVKTIPTAGPIGTTTFDWAFDESIGIEWHAALKHAAAAAPGPSPRRNRMRQHAASGLWIPV